MSPSTSHRTCSYYAVYPFLRIFDQIFRRNDATTDDCVTKDGPQDINLKAIKEYVDNPELLNIHQRVWSLTSDKQDLPHEANKKRTSVVKILHRIEAQKNDEPTPPPRTYRPDPKLVIRSILEPRRDQLPRTHRNNISALADAYLSLLSLCLYPAGFSFADASKTSDHPFFTFCPLYGQNQQDLGNIRKVDGRGMLHPDTFSYRSDLGRSQPAVAALLILWNRNHNYIAHALFIRFSATKGWKEPKSLTEIPIVQDNDIFEAAKRINCTQFRNSICEDVLKGLFGLSDFEPSAEIDILADIDGCPKGPSKAGHLQSVTRFETSLLYLMSPLMPQADGQTTEQKIKYDTEEDKAPNESLCSDKFSSLYRRSTSGLVRLVRNSTTNLYDEGDLASVIMDAREKPAGPPGSGTTTPKDSAEADARALENEDAWKMCTFNEFRKMYGLRPLSSFAAWNSDPKISTAAEKLYGSIDNLGLYVGLQCEASVRGRADRIGDRAGSGFGFGYTKTYAMLVDLVTRIRSEPPYKLDDSILRQGMGPKDPLHQWVLNETTMKWEARINGAFLPKILQRTLPHHFPLNHAYSHFLFSTPLKKDDPDLERFANAYLTAANPVPPTIHALRDSAAFYKVFNNDDQTDTKYKTVYNDQLNILTNNYGYLLGLDSDKAELHRKDRQMTMFALIPDERGSLKRYGYYFGRLTAKYIREYSLNQNDGSYTVDLIADVINNVCTRWVCETLCDYELLEDKPNSTSEQSTSKGKTTKEMYQEFANLSTFIFKMHGHDDPYTAQSQAISSSQFLQEHIRMKIPDPDWWQQNLSPKDQFRRLVRLGRASFLEMVDLWFRERRLPSRTSQTFLRRAVQASRLIRLPKQDLVAMMDDRIEKLKSFDQKVTQETVDIAERDIEISRVTANILGLAAVTAVNLPQVCSLVIDFYLQPKHQVIRKRIEHLVSKLDVMDSVGNPSPRSSKVKEHYIFTLAQYGFEAIRRSLPLALWRKCTAQDDLHLDSTDGVATQIQKGDLIFADFNYWHFLKEPAGLFDNLDDIDAPTQQEFKEVEKDIRQFFKQDFRFLGAGMHQCPASTDKLETSFIVHVIPEVMRAVFRLKGVRRVSEYQESDIKGVDASPYHTPMDPKVYLDHRGNVSFYPQTLLLQFDGPVPDVYNDSDDAGGRQSKFSLGRIVIRTTEYFLGFMTVLWAFYKAIVIALTFWRSILLICGLGPRARQPAYIPNMTEVQNLHVDCPQPLMPWDDWTTHTLAPGPDGIPLNITYRSAVPIAHQLQIYDADKKDTKAAIYVDDVLRGLTTDFELDKEIDCGDQAYQCYAHQFSFGVVVVPPGSHEISIAWAGKELTNGTYPNLGKVKFRRLLMKRDYCAS